MQKKVYTTCTGSIFFAYLVLVQVLAWYKYTSTSMCTMYLSLYYYIEESLHQQRRGGEKLLLWVVVMVSACDSETGAVVTVVGGTR